MATAQVRNTATIAGKSFSTTKSTSGNSGNQFEKTLAAAKTGQLTTRTDANTGVITGQASHGVTTGAIIDVYWTEGGVAGSRRTLTVGTVSGTSIPIDGGAGDDLPTNMTNVTMQVQTNVAYGIIGSEMLALGIQCTRKGTVILAGSDDAEDFAVPFEAGDGGYVWFKDLYGNSGDNPISGDTITQIFISNGDSSGTNKVTLAHISEATAPA